jgi:hypothetical protein
MRRIIYTSLQGIIRMIKASRLRWVGCDVYMGKIRKIHKILIRKQREETMWDVKV